MIKYTLIFVLLCGSIFAQTQPQATDPRVKRAKIIVLQRYNALGDPNSALFKNFRDIYTQAISVNSVVFQNPDWPLLIGERALESTTAISRGAYNTGLTRLEKYETEIRKLFNEGDSLTRAWAQLEWAAYQSWLKDDPVKAAELHVKQADLILKAQIVAQLAAIRNEVDQLNFTLFQLSQQR